MCDDIEIYLLIEVLDRSAMFFQRLPKLFRCKQIVPENTGILRTWSAWLRGRSLLITNAKTQCPNNGFSPSVAMVEETVKIFQACGTVIDLRKCCQLSESVSDDRPFVASPC